MPYIKSQGKVCSRMEHRRDQNGTMICNFLPLNPVGQAEPSLCVVPSCFSNCVERKVLASNILWLQIKPFKQRSLFSTGIHYRNSFKSLQAKIDVLKSILAARNFSLFTNHFFTFPCSKIRGIFYPSSLRC